MQFSQETINNATLNNKAGMSHTTGNSIQRDFVTAILQNSKCITLVVPRKTIVPKTEVHSTGKAEKKTVQLRLKHNSR